MRAAGQAALEWRDRRALKGFKGLERLQKLRAGAHPIDRSVDAVEVRGIALASYRTGVVQMDIRWMASQASLARKDEGSMLGRSSQDLRIGARVIGWSEAKMVAGQGHLNRGVLRFGRDVGSFRERCQWTDTRPRVTTGGTFGALAWGGSLEVQLVLPWGKGKGRGVSWNSLIALS